MVNRSNDLVISSWKDKADFHFLSTTHSNQLKKTIRRENGERVGATVIVAADYYTKEGMGAVDCFNKKII